MKNTSVEGSQQYHATHFGHLLLAFHYYLGKSFFIKARESQSLTFLILKEIIQHKLTSSKRRVLEKTDALQMQPGAEGTDTTYKEKKNQQPKDPKQTLLHPFPCLAPSYF
ncbi:hypothetical protein GDO81_024796 [Engystomops pustulosus]|uniref:Uncharacterized protein n=1 Tax=Engystomops pustulosus TaxID=76066 RepID=A0AAV6YMG0_ENGPU|nr:hypothetical protein GDO81_024796 [Engystomops pustulosus]